MKATLAVVGVFAVMSAGCGGSKTTRTTVVTETNVVTVAAAAPGPAPHDYARFQTPSKNIGCGYDSGVLRCDILSGLKPEPSEACELDWTGIVLEVNGAAQPECAGDTIYDGSTPILGYGELWARNGISCESRKDGLRCANGSGHGFSLARAAWDVS
jgi:uncharacterized protein DUF6636